MPTYIQDTVLDIMYSLQPGPPLNPAVLEKKYENFLSFLQAAVDNPLLEKPGIGCQL